MKKILSILKDSSYLKNSTTKFGASLATFALGALLVMNIGGVGAEAPTENPPRGEINATFDSVSTDELIISNDGAVRAAWIENYSDQALRILSSIHGVNLSGSKLFNSSGSLLIDDSLQVTGRLYLDNDSYLTSTQREYVRGSDDPYTSIGVRREVTATCPSGTHLVGCSGYLWEPGTMKNIEYMGAEKGSNETCRSYARRVSESTSAFTHYAEAQCLKL